MPLLGSRVTETIALPRGGAHNLVRQFRIQTTFNLLLEASRTPRRRFLPMHGTQQVSALCHQTMFRATAVRLSWGNPIRQHNSHENLSVVSSKPFKAVCSW